MADQEIISDFNDQKMLTTHGEDSQLRFPKIDQHARPHVKSKAEKRRNSPHLPLLKKSSQSNYDISSEIPSKRSLGNQKDRDEFALEIQQKLKLVLENVKQGENLEERSQEEQIDFQQAIQHNKQRIKQHKLQNQNKQQRNLKPHSRGQKNNSNVRQKVLKSVNKHENPYEKRIKEVSAQNKFLQKKKQIIAQKNEALEKAKLIIKQREDNLHRPNNIPFPVRFVARPKKSQQKSPPKPPPKQQKQSHNLFDNIHSLLENPLKNRVKSTNNNSQSLKTLQFKLRLVNEKLGISSETLQPKDSSDIGIANYTALDWKRFVYSDSNNFKCYQDSNFQKQIDKVNKLQQKNQQYLNQYLDHQKRLVQLSLVKKIHQNTS